MARNRIQENGLGVSSYLGLPFRSYLGLPKTMQCAQFPFYIVFYILYYPSRCFVPNFILLRTTNYHMITCQGGTSPNIILVCTKKMITCPPQGGTSPQGRKLTLEQALCWTPTLWPPRPPRCIIKKIKCDSTVYHPIQ